VAQARRRSRDLSIFSRDRDLDGKPKAQQIPAFIWLIGVNVIKEVCSDLPQLWANGGQTAQALVRYLPRWNPFHPDTRTNRA
jgi:hypothetical protein